MNPAGSRLFLITLVLLGAWHRAPAQNAAPTFAVEPRQVHLRGDRGGQQLLATLTFPFGVQQDATRAVQWSTSAAGVVQVSPDGYVTATGNGKATVTAELDGRRVAVEVTASEAGQHKPISF